MVDEEGGRSERCLKWRGWGSLRDLSKKTSLNRGVKAIVVRRGGGAERHEPDIGL